MEELFNEPDDLQTICIRQLHHICSRLFLPIYRNVKRCARNLIITHYIFVQRSSVRSHVGRGRF